MNITSVTKCLWVLTKKNLCSTFPSLQFPPASEKVPKEMSWDPKVGFTIPYGPSTMYNMLICHATVNGREFKSMYIPMRQSESFCSSFPIELKVIDLCWYVCFLLPLHWYAVIVSWSLMSPYIRPHFSASVLKNVKIDHERVRVLVGDTLVLNCTGETTYNGRINFTWEFPRKKVSWSFIFGKLYVASDVVLVEFMTFPLPSGKSSLY